MEVPDGGGEVEGRAHDGHRCFRIEDIVGIGLAMPAQVNDSAANVPAAQEVTDVFDVCLNTSFGRREDSEL